MTRSTVITAVLIILLCINPAARWAECADGGWLGKAQQRIAEREYHVTRNDQGLQAPNRANNLRIYFDENGIGVVDRLAADGSELLRLTLTGLDRQPETGPQGPGAEFDLLARPSVHSTNNRVEIRREGLTEWFVNSPNGLEHGFTIPSRPDGNGELRLTMKVSVATAEMEGDHIVLSTPAGRRLNYSDLYVIDATGRDVPARLESPDSGTIQILISDRDAPYPLTIDPILTSMADTVVESDQVEAQLGISVSGAGDVNGDGYADVIVGAERYDNGTENEGAAFVYHGSATGISTTAAAMVESNNYWALMGCSVSGAGDVNGDGYADVIVGAKSYSTGGGRAFVYHGGPSGISTVAATTLNPELAGNPRFGTSVSGAGDVNEDGYADVIVGADGYSSGQPGEGAAFVYHGGAAGISTTPATIVESNQSNAYMGESVSGAGDVNADGYDDVIVGVKMYNGGQNDEGAVFIYHGSAAGVPTTASTIIEGNMVDAYFGKRVSGAGDLNGDGYTDVIVSATLGGVIPGIAHVFYGSLTGISSYPSLMLESDQVGAGLVSFSGAGDVNGDGYADVIAGAAGYDNGETSEGAAFIYHGSATGISITPSAMVESNHAGATMGISVAGAGDVNGDGYADVIAGAYNYTNGESQEGAAFVFHGGASGISSTAAAEVESDQAAAILGWSVSDAGDVNGDGYADVIVGAFGYDNGEPDEGAAFVYHGSADGISATADAMVESDQGFANLGWSVSGAGDINGDGFADVIVGAINYDDGQTDEGAAFVYHGGPSGISTTATAMMESDQDLALMGWSVSGAGDLNGDGYADLIISAPTYDNGQTDEGVAFVYHGSASGVTTAAAMLEPDQASSFLGYSVSGAGDVNGDGYADLIVGVTSYVNGQTEEGGAFVYHGSPSGISATAAAIVESDQPNANMGTGVSGAGDVNGDGYGDVIVGAFLYDNTQPDEGAAFVYHGSASGISTSAAAMVTSLHPYAYMGFSVSGAGDVNGDGFADVIVGASSYANGQTEEGAAFIYHGGAAGISTIASTRVESDQAQAYLGHSVSGAGDVNGDGFADVIVGAASYDNGQTDEGVARIYYGNSDGRPVLARQLRGNGDTTTVQPWGVSYDPDDFQVLMVATHPDGLGRVKLQVEFCGPGVPFGDPSCETCTSPQWEGITWELVGPATRTMTVTIPGLTVNSLYRWRARVLHAHQNVSKPGITPPLNPSHGPWRRLAGQSSEADIRIQETGGSPGTISADLTCAPPSGTLPIVTNMSVTLTNNYGGQTRRIAARINLTIGGGQSYPNWRSGFTNVAAGGSYTTAWNQTIPALAAVIGSNVFQLVAEDVTPTPYNQPPYPPAGDTDTSSCTVIGIAP